MPPTSPSPGQVWMTYLINDGREIRVAGVEGTGRGALVKDTGSRRKYGKNTGSGRMDEGTAGIRRRRALEEGTEVVC